MYVVPCRHPQMHALDLMLSRSYLFTITLHYKYLDVNWHYGKSIYGKNTYYSFGTLHSRQFLAFSKQQMVRAWWSEISALPLIQRSPHSSLLVRVQKVASFKKKNGVAPFFLTPVQIPDAADTVALSGKAFGQSHSSKFRLLWNVCVLLTCIHPGTNLTCCVTLGWRGLWASTILPSSRKVQIIWLTDVFDWGPVLCHSSLRQPLRENC